MRVIAGKAKGKRLKFPRLAKGKKIRPLTDVAKAALFNILASKVVESFFLDLFAGTGGVGIEALSRGAKIAIFVEKNRRVVQIIRENLKTTELEELAEVYSLDVIRAIKILDSKGSQFDIIFAGAPYDSPLLEKTLGRLAEANILKQNGVIIAEHRHKQVLADAYGGLSRVRQNKHGDTVLSFYRKEPT